jgi:hypothetical protein
MVRNGQIIYIQACSLLNSLLEFKLAALMLPCGATGESNPQQGRNPLLNHHQQHLTDAPIRPWHAEIA